MTMHAPVTARLRRTRAVAAALALVPATIAAAGGQWSIVATYPIPESASGLAWDGTWLYCGIYGVDGGRVYRIDPADGTYALLFTGPQEDAYGLTWDGTHLWTTDHPGSSSTPAVAMKLDLAGNLVDQFDLPEHYVSGIAFEAGEFWVTRYFPDPGFVFRLDGAGAVLDSFAGPDNQPWDVCFENGNLWIADYWGDALYKVDPTSGALLESHPSEGVDPAGIVWDGSHLWYCDNGAGGNDFLYKVDLSGAGTPAIGIPVDTHAFGTVPIGDVASWDVTIDNNGSAALEIASIDFAGAGDLSSTAVFPVVIPAGMSDTIKIEFAPTVFGHLDVTATVQSNDPVNPAEPLTLTGDGVYPDATIALSAASHDYGAVRVGAHTRWFLEVENQGDQVLTISDISSDDAHFYVDANVSLPVVLNTLETAQIGLWFSPDAVSAVSADVSLDSNDPGLATAIVDLSGTGDDSPRPIGSILWSYTIDAGFDNSPKAMASIPDVSGDGRPDVIVCSEDDHIRCFNGNGHGAGDVLWDNDFGLGYVYDQKGIQVIPDIDDDGFHDVIVGTAGGARVVRALNGRLGNEIWTYDTAEYGDGGWVYQVHALYDYNGDGSVDVLASAGDDSTDTGPKRIFCLNGLSGVKLWEHALGGPGFAVIGVEDFTGDGLPDVVAGASDEFETQGRAVGLDGTDGSLEWTFLGGSTSVWGLAQINDITADGIRDVAIADFLSGNVYGLDATDGTERWTASGFGLISRLQVVDDLNGDGHPDIVPAHSSDFARAVSGRNGVTIWTTPTADNCSSVARLDDVGGDGLNDVVVGTLFSNNFTYFLDGANGTVMQSDGFGEPVDAITTIPDVVGDGSWEMIAGGREGKVVCISGGTAVATCDGDSDGSGVVDVTDLVNVVLDWGTDGSANGGDVDDNGIVDVGDLVTVILNWGDCPGT